MSDPDLDAAEARLAEVEAALERVEEGSYGRCASCGSPIPRDLLVSDPLSSRCAECAEPAGGPR